ncbi:MAG TPA: signal peptidase I [Smithellaceae bacterium]|jgi:signal peptidase I|nr:signal peptidase I [Syntrophaceae bacterium]HPL96891.1 signal peptidase I [Smithellaceae bacterium]HPV48313.1 signal peptidase I [Smithellaceae bacterium]
MSKKKTAAEKPKSKIRDFFESVLIAFVIAAFIISFVVQAFKIPSGSMIPTLLIGDHLFVNKFIYGVKIPFFRKTIIPVTDPGRGDVIVFIFPQDRSKDFIKRVIGLPGDTIEMKNKKLYINHEAYEDPYGVYTDPVILPAEAGPRDNFGPLTVPENSLFVMGDNRDHSLDSRFWGFVELKDVLGKAFIIYWSWNSEEKSVRLERLAGLIK